VGDEVTDTTVERAIERWTEEQRVLRVQAQRFADLGRLLAPVMRPNETPEETVMRLGTR